MSSVSKVLIFGTGSAGLRAWENIFGKYECDVIAFADNDSRKHGKELLEVPVVGAEQISKLAPDAVLIASMYSLEIEQQLLRLGHDQSKIVALPIAGEPDAFRKALSKVCICPVSRGASDVDLSESSSRIVILGTGTTAMRAWALAVSRSDCEVVSFVDFSEEKCGKQFLGKKIVGSEQLYKLDYEFIVVGEVDVSNALVRLDRLGVESDRVRPLSWLEEEGVPDFREIAKKSPEEVPQLSISSLVWSALSRRLVNRCSPGKFLVMDSSVSTVGMGMRKLGVRVDAAKIVSSGSELKLEVEGSYENQGDRRPDYFDNDHYETIIVVDGLRRIDGDTKIDALLELHRICNSRIIFINTKNLDYYFSLLNRTKGARDWFSALLKVLFREDHAFLRKGELRRDQILYPLQLAVFEKTHNIEDIDSYDFEIDGFSRVLEEPQAFFYEQALGFLRRGSVVLDVGCGAGLGSALLHDKGESVSVLGIDDDPAPIAYGQKVLARGKRYRLKFVECADFDFSFLENNSCDLVVVRNLIGRFSTDISQFASEASRVLRPGGRMLFSLEGREDDGMEREYVSEIKIRFIPECVYSKSDEGEGLEWKQFEDLTGIGELGSLLISVMKDPVKGEGVPFSSTPFPFDPSQTPIPIAFQHFYVNPWLVESVILEPFRMRSKTALARLCENILEVYKADTADYGGALCVLAYQSLKQGNDCWVRRKIDKYLELSSDNPHVLRWQISLSFVLGKIALNRAETDEALHFFAECSIGDFSLFGPHLATKCSEAAYIAGWIEYMSDNLVSAKVYWKRGLEIVDLVNKFPMTDILISESCPAQYEVGDGMREITIVYDNAIRCSNGLRAIHFRESGSSVDSGRIGRSFMTVIEVLSRELHERTAEIESLKRSLES